VPSFLKVGDPTAEITANVYDPAGIRTVYALVGNRMNLNGGPHENEPIHRLLRVELPPGTYRVTIVAIDRAGNAAQAQSATNLTIIDPSLNANHIENSLENRMNEDLG